MESEQYEHAFFRCLTTRLLHAICEFYIARDATRKELIPFHRPGSHGIKVVRDAEHRAISELPECAGIVFSAKTYQHIVDKIVQDSERVETLLANPNLKGSVDLFSGLRNEHNERVDWDGRVLSPEELKREELLPVAARIAFPVSTMQLERECAEHGILDPAKKEEYLKQHKLRYVESVIKIYRVFHRAPRAHPELSITAEEDTTWLQKDLKRRKRSAKQLDVTSTFMMSPLGGGGVGDEDDDALQQQSQQQSHSHGHGLDSVALLHPHKKTLKFDEIDLLRGGGGGSGGGGAATASSSSSVAAAAMAPVVSDENSHFSLSHSHVGVVPVPVVKKSQPAMLFTSRALPMPAPSHESAMSGSGPCPASNALDLDAALGERERDSSEEQEQQRQRAQFDLQREKEREVFELLTHEENCVDAHNKLALRQWIDSYGLTSALIVRGMDDNDWNDVVVCLKTGPRKTLLGLRQELKNIAVNSAAANAK